MKIKSYLDCILHTTHSSQHFITKMSPHNSMSDLSKALDTLDTTDTALIQLKKQKIELTAELAKARKKLQPQGSFDASFWVQATLIEKLSLERSESTRKISLKEYNDPHTPWEYTEAGKNLLKQIEAERQSISICEERVNSLGQKAPHKRSLRSSFIKLFTTSTMGLAITGTGAGKRNTRDQFSFRKRLIEVYDAENCELDCLWCPVLGQWVDKEMVKASHIFPWKHGQATMDAIFGEKRPSEMFSERNGLLMHARLEEAFDKGVFVIIPDLPNEPSIPQMIRWRFGKGREYKIKILDLEWNKLDKPIALGLKTFRELDGTKLEFSNPNNPKIIHRPAARYLYFHYCMQVLQKAWQNRAQGKMDGATSMLKAENGRFFWGTRGGYLPQNMLLAFVEELGHGYEELLEGSSCVQSNEQNLLLAVGAVQAKRAASGSLTDSGLLLEDEEDEEDESETSSEEAD